MALKNLEEFIDDVRKGDLVIIVAKTEDLPNGSEFVGFVQNIGEDLDPTPYHVEVMPRYVHFHYNIEVDSIHDHSFSVELKSGLLDASGWRDLPVIGYEIIRRAKE